MGKLKGQGGNETAEERDDFSKLLKVARERSGLLQTEMAKRLEVDVSRYRAWEYGASTVPAFVIKRLLRLKEEVT